MALTPEERASYRAALWRALGTGTKTVSWGDKSTTFGTPAEIREALAALDAEERQASGESSGRVTYASFSRG